jgi:ubiquinone/menaquinone biosynthesis C-methylase UbiE
VITGPALLFFLPFTISAQIQDAPHPKISEERIYRYDRQDVTVPDFEAPGYILDIGGGGEGIIGRLKPKQVVAIDLNRRELAEAPPGPLKIVMDATELKFLDDTFPTVTSFFTLMYIKPADQDRVFREVHRVLAPGGRFLIWDVILPPRFDSAKDIAVFPFRFKLPGEIVETGYGTRFPDQPHDLAYFRRLAENTGFRETGSKQKDRHFFLELRKP